MRIMKIEANVNLCQSTLATLMGTNTTVATFDLELEVDSLAIMIKEFYTGDGEHRDYISDYEIEDWVLNNCSEEDIIYMLTDSSKEKMDACYKLFGNNTNRDEYIEAYVTYILDNYDKITFPRRSNDE